MPAPESIQASAPIRPPWWFRLVRALLNLALLGLLCLQGFLLVILWTDNHLGLPGFARHALEDRLQDQGLSVRFSSIEASLSGRLLLRDPQIYLTGSRDPIAEAEYLEIDPDWLALWWNHQVAFSELRLYNANFYCPPESSPSGVREAFIQRLDVELASEGHRWWRLGHLRGEFLNADIEAQGTFLWSSVTIGAPSAPIVSNPANAPKQTLAATFRGWAKAAVALQPQFSQVNNPEVRLTLAGEESGVTHLGATFLAKGAKLPASGATLGRLRGRGDFIWDGSDLRAAAPITASTESMEIDKPAAGKESSTASITSGAVEVKVEPAAGPNGLWGNRPKGIQFSASDTKVGDFPSDTMTADFDLRQWPRLSLTAFLTHGQDSLKVDGQTKIDWSGVSPEVRDGQFEYQVQAPLATFLAAGHWTLPAGLESLRFNDALKIEGRIEFATAHQLDSIDWTAHTGGAHFQQLDLDQTIARGRLTRGADDSYLLDLSQISLIAKTWRADGSYFENLQTHEFRLLAHGNLDPNVLNPYLGDWWPPLWKIIVPQGRWPQVNLEFSGKWDGPWWDKDLSVYALVEGPKVQGVPMDDIRIRALQRPEYIAVYDIAAHAAGGGDVSGAMVWAINQANDHIVEQRYFFDSTLPLAEVAALVGPQVADLVKPLDCPIPPTLHVDQRTGTAFNLQLDAVATRIHAEFSTPFRLFNVPFDQASLDATDAGNITNFQHLHFGIAGGTAQAEVTVVHPEDTAQMDFKVLLQNARQDDFMAALGQFNAGDIPMPSETQPSPSNSAATKNKNSVLGGLNHPGLLDIALGGRFTFGQPDSLLGVGQLRIHDAQLGQLQLFGRLSKFLADTKVPLGDFDLHNATSDLQIAKEYLRLPNLVITGPSARIQAAGTYHFSDDGLDFNTLIFPIGQSDSFLLKQIAAMANPFVNTITLKLHGDMDKPIWEISMNPLRLFKDRTVEGPSIPGVQADANGTPILPILPTAPALPDLPAEKP